MTKKPLPDPSNDPVHSLAQDLLGLDLNAPTDSDEPLEVEGLGLEDLGFGPPPPQPEPAVPDSPETADAPAAPHDDDPLAWIVKAAKTPPSPRPASQADDWDDDFGSGIIDADDDDTAAQVDQERADQARVSGDLDSDDDDLDDAEEILVEEDVEVLFGDEESELLDDEEEEAPEVSAAEKDAYWEALEGWNDWDDKPEGESESSRGRSRGRDDRGRSSGSRGERGRGKSEGRGRRSGSEERSGTKSHEKRRGEVSETPADTSESSEKPSHRPRRGEKSERGASEADAPRRERKRRSGEEPRGDSERPSGRRPRRDQQRRSVPPEPVAEDLDDDEFGAGILSGPPKPAASRRPVPEALNDDDEFGFDEPDIESEDDVDEDPSDEAEFVEEASDYGDDEGFGAGLEVDEPQPSKRRRPPRQRRAPRSATASPAEAVPSGRGRQSGSRQEPAASETAGGTQKEKYAGIPTWEEAIALLSRKQSRGGGNGGRRSSGGGRGDDRRRRGGGRERRGNGNRQEGAN